MNHNDIKPIYCESSLINCYPLFPSPLSTGADVWIGTGEPEQSYSGLGFAQQDKWITILRNSQHAASRPRRRLSSENQQIIHRLANCKEFLPSYPTNTCRDLAPKVVCLIHVNVYTCVCFHLPCKLWRQNYLKWLRIN